MTIKSCITPISGPSIRWNIFLKDTLDLTGHSSTREIDASGLKLGDYARFISAIGEFQNNGAIPIDTLKNNSALLHHLYFSFLITGSSELILKINELHITSTKIKGGRVALVSGNLVKWRQLTIELCKDPIDYKIGKTLLDFFSKLDLQYIFANYTRTQQSNGTLLLEYKAL